MDVAHFIPLAEFRRITGQMMRELRSATLAPGQARIYTAGEKEHENMQLVLAQGVEIPPGVQKALDALRRELALSGHDLGF
jgi:LDH2 family malate/lactate/ureidoglycolate dehydrogenase